MSRLFIDTSYVIALVNKRDKYHAQALRLVAQYTDQPFLTTNAVLMEVGNALARHFKPAAVTIIEQFMSSPDVTLVHITPEHFNSAFQLYRQYQDKQWGMVDCLSFVVMRTYQADTALTPDQYFVQAGFSILMT
ncbi:MAG: PIN domain-containing protein [Chloroflexi bacterium]|nr:PIN domain-containing protein [Chloroflexota bacterium]